jgi:ferrous iron transport protein B
VFFVVDGVLGGVFAVISFLPQILILFLLFSILEDSGYMARVAFILDKLFRKFGLSGRAFLPMVMGFGCSVPAIVNTRTIADEKERLATIRVIPFFSCGAKLPILTAISGSITYLLTGFSYVDLVTLSMYALGMIVAIVTLIVMRITTLRGQSSPFIMELPTYRLPQFKSTMLLVWDKAKHFVIKAFTIILASTIVIWFISHFSFDWKFLDSEGSENSILANIGSLIQPLFIPLGFGIPSLGWVFVVSAITGLIAKENAIATLATIAGSVIIASGADEQNIINIFVNENGFTVPMLLSFIAFNMLTIPCFAAVATAKGEMNKNKFIGSLIFWIVTSYAVSSAIYTIGTWWWTSFIWLVAIIIIVIALVLYNKAMIKKERQIKVL